MREEDFGYELQKMSLVFRSDLHKVKLWTQLKTLIHIVEKKQIKIKDAIIIILLLNAPQILLVSEVLRFVKLILIVPTTNAKSERSCSMLYRFKTCPRSSLTQELLIPCLILATYKKKVDELKLVEVANQFCFKQKHCFSIKEKILPQKVYQKGQHQKGPKHKM